MKAWMMTAFGGPEVLELRDDEPSPHPGLGDVRVRVKAIAVARTKDVAMRAGNPPFAPRVSLPHRPGTEHAGVVDAVGPGADMGLLGNRVAVSAVLVCGECVACRRGRDDACSEFSLIGVDRWGCYAEHVIVPAGNVHLVPDDVPLPMAAALAANGPVARAQLDAGGVGPGSVVAVMGAAGALGSTAVCLAHHRGASVIAVDRLERTARTIAGLPVDAAFDGDDPDLGDRLRAHASGWGVDCVIDNLGLVDLWSAYRPALAPLGRIVVSGAIGREPIGMALLPFYLHSQSLIGVRTGNRAHVAGLWEEVRDGFRLPDAAVVTLPWSKTREAHAMVEGGHSAAQTVLEVP